MQLRFLAKAVQNQTRNQSPSKSPLLFTVLSRLFSHLSSSDSNRPPSFGIAFDIDGVVLRGESPIAGSREALRRLYDSSSGALEVPYIFLTKGGGSPESKRAYELSKLFDVKISPLQVVQGHTPFRQLAKRFENELVVAVGKGEPALVMSEYGFKNVVSMDEYASYFDCIDPLARYKTWTIKHAAKQGSPLEEMKMRSNICSQRVQAAFIVSDSVDWSRDIQVLCDILRTGGLPGKEIGHQPHLYFANDDLAYQATFPSEWLGMGAFRIALESIFNSIHPNALEYTSYGKPKPFVFKNAEAVLKQLVSSLNYGTDFGAQSTDGTHHFKTLYMIGDNPSVDIRGARQAGHPSFSILTRTGVFKDAENHSEFPADLVVNTGRGCGLHPDEGAGITFGCSNVQSLQFWFGI